jgi:hypothetical protein
MRSYLANKTAYFVFDSQKSRDFDIVAGLVSTVPALKLYALPALKLYAL